MTEAVGPDIACLVPGCLSTTPRREKDDYARVKGWHIYRYRSVDGSEHEDALCPGHAGNKPREKPVALDGEQPLW